MMIFFTIIIDEFPINFTNVREASFAINKMLIVYLSDMA